MYYFIEIIMTIIDYYLLYLCGSIFFKTTKKNTYVIGYLIIMCLIANLVYSQINNLIINTIIEAFFIVIIVYQVFEDRVRKKINFACLYYLFLRLVTIFLMIIVHEISNITIKDLYEFSYKHVSFMVLTKNVLFIIIVFMKYKIKYKSVDIEITNKHNRFLYIVLPLGLLIIVILYFSTIYSEELNIEISLALIALLLFIIIILFIGAYQVTTDIIQENADLKMVQMLNENKRNQFYKLKKNQNRIMKIRHDMNNTLISIKMLLDKGELENIQQILEQRIQDIDSLVKIIESGDSTIDALLNHHINRNNDLEFEVDIVLKEEIKIKQTDIIDILGNALENAIEASQKYKIKKGETIPIKIAIKSSSENLFIQIENNYLYTKKDNNRLVTVKKDSNIHGIGLKSIRNCVDRNCGSMLINEENSIFCLNIIVENGCLE